jgi:hypothetical protein
MFGPWLRLSRNGPDLLRVRLWDRKPNSGESDEPNTPSESTDEWSCKSGDACLMSWEPGAELGPRRDQR